MRSYIKKLSTIFRRILFKAQCCPGGAMWKAYSGVNTGAASKNKTT